MTLPSVVVAFNILIDKIETICKDLDCKTNRSPNDELLILAFQAGRDKLLKHYLKCNWIYCVSLILDPRHKLDCFDFTEWGKDMKDKSIEKFESLYSNLYIQRASVSPQKEMASSLVKDNDEIDFNYLYDTKKKSTDLWKTELNSYYQAPRADKDVDILVVE